MAGSRMDQKKTEEKKHRIRAEQDALRAEKEAEDRGEAEMIRLASEIRIKEREDDRRREIEMIGLASDIRRMERELEHQAFMWPFYEQLRQL